jgi:hypothetical protein
VSQRRLACTGSPSISPEFTITAARPACTAARNGGRKSSRTSRSVSPDGVRSRPERGAP